MLKVFICEDNYMQKESIENIIKNTIAKEELDIEIALSTSMPNKILDYISINQEEGIYFLDIDLNSDINGIQLAEQIRQYDPRGFIVFVTTHAEMSYLTFIYKVEAMDYIIKDDYFNMEERIAQCILNANKKYTTKKNNTRKIFTIKVEDRIINIDFDDIIYFQTSEVTHKLILHTESRQIEFFARIKEVEKQLDNRFCRCHRSYIINKDYVKEIDTKKRIVYMINGIKCLASVRLIKKLA